MELKNFPRKSATEEILPKNIIFLKYQSADLSFNSAAEYNQGSQCTSEIKMKCGNIQMSYMSKNGG